MTLRIQKSAEAELLVFRLIGRIQAEQVPALRALFKSEVPGQNVALDLKEVRLVDRDAVRFLAQSEAEGARLRGCPQFIREWIRRERDATQGGQAQPPEVQKE